MSYSENNTFEKIMDRALSNPILDLVDKREGSIIYDALAPMAMELANLYVIADIMEQQSYLLYATGVNLDNKVYDYGIKREQATKAKRIGQFLKKDGDSLVDMDIPVGSRFGITDETTNTTFIYTGIVDGYRILECEQFGTIGNVYNGTILPLTPINGLVESNIIGTYVPAQDVETDEELRTRTLDIINEIPFGGNISDYIEKLKSIDGVGNAKIFPAWNGGGTVLASVVDSSYEPISDYFKEVIKGIVDPENGNGVGTAPIGHFVTITTPTDYTIDIKMSISLEPNVLIGNVREAIEDKIIEHFNNVRKDFRQDSTLAIYRARLISTILDVDEVLNVTNVLLNGVDEDVILVDDIYGQYLPKLGEIVIE